MIAFFLRSGARLAALCVLFLFLSACDTNDANEGSPFDGRWRASVPVDWTKTYALPAGASADSVRYDHVGVHVFTVDLREEGAEVRGTVDWDREGTYTVTTYDGGDSILDRDEIVYDEFPVAATATHTNGTLVFDRSDNDWISGTDPAELTLRDGRLEGELLHTYLVQSWPVSGSNSQVETRLEVPITVELVRIRR